MPPEPRGGRAGEEGAGRAGSPAVRVAALRPRRPAGRRAVPAGCRPRAAAPGGCCSCRRPGRAEPSFPAGKRPGSRRGSAPWAGVLQEGVLATLAAPIGRTQRHLGPWLRSVWPVGPGVEVSVRRGFGREAGLASEPPRKPIGGVYCSYPKGTLLVILISCVVTNGTNGKEDEHCL